MVHVIASESSHGIIALISSATESVFPRVVLRLPPTAPSIKRDSDVTTKDHALRCTSAALRLFGDSCGLTTVARPFQWDEGSFGGRYRTALRTSIVLRCAPGLGTSTRRRCRSGDASAPTAVIPAALAETVAITQQSKR